METISPEVEGLIATANADLYPTALENTQRAEELWLAQDIRESNPPAAAEAYVEAQAGYLLSMVFALRAEAQGDDATVYWRGAELDYAEAERLRAEANRLCADASGGVADAGGDVGRAEPTVSVTPTPTAVVATGGRGSGRWRSRAGPGARIRHLCRRPTRTRLRACANRTRKGR